MVRMFDGRDFVDVDYVQKVAKDRARELAGEKLRECVIVDRAYNDGVMEQGIAQEIIRLDKLPMKLHRRRYL